MLNCWGFSRGPSKGQHNHGIARSFREGRAFQPNIYYVLRSGGSYPCEGHKRENGMIMEEPGLLPLARWESFYVIVGSSAGALTGLQFVVMALIAEAESGSSMLEVRAFGTPTVVHFCAALLISAVLSAPWHSLSHAGIAL